jgi:glycosyltransferase involved in cell wall biosynthesis
VTVLHILHAARAEGTVRLALDWLEDTRIRQEVVTLSAQPADLQPEIERRAAWYERGTRIPAGRVKFPWMLFRSWQVCRRRKPDMAICWMNGFSPWILAGARLAGVRRLITHAGNPPDRTPMGRAQTVFSTLVAWLTGGRMVCCSAYVASAYRCSRGAFSSVLRTVPNCAQVSRIRSQAEQARRGREKGGVRFVMVATLEGHKDHATLIRAMALVVRELPDSELWIVGDGSLRASLERQRDAAGLDGSVVFLGSRGDVASLLGKCDVFVFSTTPAEGLGTVLIEAMAAGLPIVASAVPACEEATAGGKWGTLVAPADPAALAAAMVAQGRHPGSEETGERREYLERFLPDRMIEGYLAAAP